MKQTTKIKICGLTMPEEAAYIIDNAVEYCGMVLFFPKSKRNITTQQAEVIINALQVVVNEKSTDIVMESGTERYLGPKKVAVTVSPTLEQAKEIVKCGFDILQIHGKLDKDILGECNIPILRAYNSSDIPEGGKFCDIEELNVLLSNDKVMGFLFDASAPGSGKTFDYKLLDNIKLGNKKFALAGGLNPYNVDKVLQDIGNIKPDIVDTSSGVENDNGQGKDPEKIKKFVDAVRR